MDRAKVMVETLHVLLLCALGGGLSGLILGSMSSILELVPGLIALVPAIIGMRGNISSAMGSRLGSAVHLGLVEEGISSKVAMENLKSSLSLSVYISVILPIFYTLTTIVLPFSLNPIIIAVLFMISILTGTTSGIFLTLLAFFIVRIAVKLEIDPDNITGPLLSTVGDFVTLLILFSYAAFIGGSFL